MQNVQVTLQSTRENTISSGKEFQNLSLCVFMSNILNILTFLPLMAILGALSTVSTIEVFHVLINLKFLVYPLSCNTILEILVSGGSRIFCWGGGAPTRLGAPTSDVYTFQRKHMQKRKKLILLGGGGGGARWRRPLDPPMHV